MERFDRTGVSFVSLTQEFNTTSSMGRLTLNILLSFAQYEKEIIGERTRDKQSAARRKGKWIGGWPVLGYDVEGIELRDFPAEIARLALVIAEYQADVIYRGQKVALSEFLPLDEQKWITCGNALRLDWLSICPPTGTGVKLQADDLFSTPLDQAQIDFENDGGETYICGNPPYLGSTWQSAMQKSDLGALFGNRTKSWKSLDYVAGWFMKAADYGTHTKTSSAFVSTNSICQGQLAPIIWPLIFKAGHDICFAHTGFKWANLASHNAGVTVVIVGISNQCRKPRQLFSVGEDGKNLVKDIDHINANLVPGPSVHIEKRSVPLSNIPVMDRGNGPLTVVGLFFREQTLRAS
jgi:hypothetical protein